MLDANSTGSRLQHRHFLVNLATGRGMADAIPEAIRFLVSGKAARCEHHEGRPVVQKVLLERAAFRVSYVQVRAPGFRVRQL